MINSNHSSPLPLRHIKNEYDSSTITLSEVEYISKNSWQKLWSRWSSYEVGYPHKSNFQPKKQDDEESSIDSIFLNEEQVKIQTLIILCKTLMLYGAPCHRIEQALEHSSECLKIDATFIFIPGIMMMTFNDIKSTPTHSFSTEKSSSSATHNINHSQTILIRCPQGFDMGKLAIVNETLQNLCNEKCTPAESVDKLNRLISSKPTWNAYITLLSHMMSSLLTSPVMFNGSLLDTALSGALGLLVGMLILLSDRYEAYSNIFEITTTILISFVTKALDRWVCFTGVVLSAASILIPGYTLTMSIMELSARHVITGTLRFVYAMIYALFIGYGLEIGTSIYDAVDPATSPSEFDVCSGTVPPWLYTALFPFMAVSLSINMGATVRQWPSMICCSAVGFGVSVIMSKLITNFQIVGTISAFAVGVFGNIYFKVTGDLALVPLSCGIVSLVPGSVGIQGAYFLIRQDDQGISFAIQMVVASLGISVGLFAASLAVTKSERKRLAYLSY